MALKNQEIYTADERRCQVRWLKNLNHVEERRLYAKAGYESLWRYVHKGLGYAEGSVGKRIQVARLIKKFPLVADFLEGRKLSLTAASRLSPVLTDENHRKVLSEASGKNVREVEELVVSLSPKPDICESKRASSGAENATQAAIEIAPLASPEPALPAKKEKSRPLSPERYHLNFSIDRETNDKHRKLVALARDRAISMEDVFKAGVEALLAVHDPDVKLKRKKNMKPRPVKHATRYFPRETRRVVREQYGSRCAFVSADGKRCEATPHLQYDHIRPWALGGTSEPENIRLLCQSHNLWMAVESFGREKIERHIRS